MEGLYSCLDYYQDAGDPFSRALLQRYDERYPGQRAVHGRQRVLGAVPRPEALGGRGEEAGTLDPEDVVQALDQRGSPRGREVRPRWCPGSTTCG